MSALNGWIPLAVTVILAIYGWYLIARLAKWREAYDLYCSTILLLEQLEVDGIRVWTGRLDDLDEYTELKLTSKLAAVEQRLGIIEQYYRFRRNCQDAIIKGDQIAELRTYLTIAYDREPNERCRLIRIHRLITTMIKNLLEASYDSIRKHRWPTF